MTEPRFASKRTRWSTRPDRGRTPVAAPPAARARPMMGGSRGAHLVLAGLPLKGALLLAGVRKGHRLFAIPWRNATLFGTTDLPDDGDPGRSLPEIEDLRVLLGEAQRLFPGAG